MASLRKAGAGVRHAGETPWQGLRAGLSGPRTDGRRRQRAWRAAVGSLDALVRRHYRIYEYTSDPECVLRVGLARAPRDVRLADGTVIGRGSPVGVLHLWNEHLPPFASQGPDLQWAKVFHRRMHRSFALLADYIARTPAWDGVQAVRAEISLADAAHARPILRLCER